MRQETSAKPAQDLPPEVRSALRDGEFEELTPGRRLRLSLPILATTPVRILFGILPKVPRDPSPGLLADLDHDFEEATQP